MRCVAVWQAGYGSTRQGATEQGEAALASLGKAGYAQAWFGRLGEAR